MAVLPPRPLRLAAWRVRTSPATREEPTWETVDHEADEVVGEGRIERLPQVLEALASWPVAKERLLGLSVGVGVGVLHEMMEAEVDEVVGPKGRHDPDR